MSIFRFINIIKHVCVKNQGNELVAFYEDNTYLILKLNEWLTTGLVKIQSTNKRAVINIT